MSRIHRGNCSEGQPDGLEQRHNKEKKSLRESHVTSPVAGERSRPQEPACLCSPRPGEISAAPQSESC